MFKAIVRFTVEDFHVDHEVEQNDRLLCDGIDPPFRVLGGNPKRRVTYLGLVPPRQERTAPPKCVRLFVLRPSLDELWFRCCIPPY